MGIVVDNIATASPPVIDEASLGRGQQRFGAAHVTWLTACVQLRRLVQARQGFEEGQAALRLRDRCSIGPREGSELLIHRAAPRPIARRQMLQRGHEPAGIFRAGADAQPSQSMTVVVCAAR